MENKLQKNIFLVGGFLRDEFIGVPSNDRDYVMVGYSDIEIENMGGKRVGNDFSVYLLPSLEKGQENNPEQCEHARARTERSTGPGYTDFESINENISIEEDLSRRDLTINAIARNIKTGEIIDPFHGKEDIHNKIIRHVSDAFREDPVRILRTARFSARFSDFTIASETITLMKNMVKNGDINSLTKERVWKELEKVLMEDKPSIFFKILDEVGALEILFPEIYNLKNKKQNPKHHFEGDAYIHSLMVLDTCSSILKEDKKKILLLEEAFNKNNDNETLKSIKLAKENYTQTMFGALMHDIGKGFISEELIKLGKYHNHDSLDLNIELTDLQRKIFHIPNEVQNIQLIDILNLIKKRLGQDSHKYIEIAKIAIETHQKIHTFHSLKATTKVKFLENGFAHKKDENKLSIILNIAKADSFGRYKLVDTVKDTEIIVDNIDLSSINSFVVKDSVYLQSDSVFSLFQELIKINAKSLQLDVEKLNWKVIKIKLYEAKVSKTKSLKNNSIIKKIEEKPQHNKKLSK